MDETYILKVLKYLILFFDISLVFRVWARERLGVLFFSRKFKDKKMLWMKKLDWTLRINWHFTFWIKLSIFSSVDVEYVIKLLLA